MRYHEASIPPSVIAGLTSYAREHGVDTSRWFAGTRVTAEQCEAPDTRISLYQAAQIIRRAVDTFPAQPLGLLMGTRDSLVAFGLLGVAIMSAETLADAMPIAMEHHQTAGSLVDLTIELNDDELVNGLYERYPAADLLPFLAEECFAAIVLIIRTALNEDVKPLRLELAYPPPAYAAAYRRFFGCPIYFDADVNRLALPTAILARRLPRHNPANLAASLVALSHERILDERTTTDLVASLERLLDATHGARITMSQAAHCLHVSERTLRRHLATAGETFTAIRERVLERRARALLTDPRHLPLAAIAEDLGYRDSREFRRAFRRWTGTTPSAAR